MSRARFAPVEMNVLGVEKDARGLERWFLLGEVGRLEGETERQTEEGLMHKSDKREEGDVGDACTSQTDRQTDGGRLEVS